VGAGSSSNKTFCQERVYKMQCVSKCNYNINTQKKEIYEYLLTVITNPALYAFSKKDLKYKRKALAREAVAKGKFLYYNQNLITELIFDIDNISNTVAYDLDFLYKIFYEKFGIPWTWSCKTDRGVQFCISVNTFYKLSKKQLRVLRDFKEYIIDNFPLLDKAGSKRLKGWWRNPFKQKDFRFYGNRIAFTEVLDFLRKNKLDIKQQFKAKIRKKQIKQSVNRIQQKIYLTVGEAAIGNRNNYIFYNLMLNTNSKNLNTIFKLAQQLNQKTEEKLDNKELLKISKNVWNYNKNDKNYIYKNSKKANWNIGAMGFEKISNLPLEEYLKEVKRRQSMAGKLNAEIGKRNLIKTAKEKAEATKEKVYEAIKELKKRNEKVTILKVVKLAKVSKNSASKYIKQAKEEGII